MENKLLYTQRMSEVTIKNKIEQVYYHTVNNTIKENIKILTMSPFWEYLTGNHTVFQID